MKSSQDRESGSSIILLPKLNPDHGVLRQIVFPVHILLKILLFMLLVSAVHFFFSSVASAEIYQWKDASGNVIYSDSPPSGVNARVKQLPAEKIDRPETGKDLPDSSEKPAATGLRPVSDISVILYRTDWCPYCKKAHDFLVSRGVRLTEYNIDKNKEKREEMRRKSDSNNIPVIDVEGEIITGFVPGAISSAIEEKRRQK